MTNNDSSVIQIPVVPLSEVPDFHIIMTIHAPFGKDRINSDHLFIDSRDEKGMAFCTSCSNAQGYQTLAPDTPVIWCPPEHKNLLADYDKAVLAGRAMVVKRSTLDTIRNGYELVRLMPVASS